MVKYILSFLLLISLGVILIFGKIRYKVPVNKTDYKEYVRYLNFDSIIVDGINIDTFTINQGTFNVTTFVLLTSDTIVLKQITGWKNIGFAEGLTTEGFIWISNPYDKGLVAHEIFHQAWLTLNMSAVPIDNKTDEVLAYEIGRITNEFYKNWFNKK